MRGYDNTSRRPGTRRATSADQGSAPWPPPGFVPETKRGKLNGLSWSHRRGCEWARQRLRARTSTPKPSSRRSFVIRQTCSELRRRGSFRPGFGVRWGREAHDGACLGSGDEEAPYGRVIISSWTLRGPHPWRGLPASSGDGSSRGKRPPAGPGPLSRCLF